MNLYIIIKRKSNIKGFWQDNNGKIYIDNIKIIDYSEKAKLELFKSGELAVFYCDNNKAYIEDKNGKIDVLRVKKIIHYKRVNKTLIKELLSIYNGFTVYRNKTFKDFTIEIWQ